MLSKRLLQLKSPKASEPVCSGDQVRMSVDSRIDLAHFHTVVTIFSDRVKSKAFFFSSGSSSGQEDVALTVSATINGREYDKQTFVISRDEIGKTLFCAGFPCVTIISYDKAEGVITMTLSEIVEPCEPGSCPWGDD
jgi:hypothetical protein